MSISETSSETFSESIHAFLPKLVCREAVRVDEKEKIYRLRYSAYLREDALPHGAPEVFRNSHDDSENGATFGVYVNNRLASSIRLHVATRAMPDCPGLSAFSDYLRPLINSGITVIDPTRFVTDYVCSRLYSKLPYATVRIAWMACEHFDADLLLAAVRTEHQSFYRRLFGHRLVCEARPYPSLSKPISLMALDCRRERDRVERRYPFFRSTESERLAIFGERLKFRSGKSPYRRSNSEAALRLDLGALV
jgi:hypothetical protein